MAQQQFACINVAMATSGNEYSASIPPGAIDVKIKLADATNAAKIYTASVGNGGTPANYWTINPGQILEMHTKMGGQTFYLMGATNSLVAQILYHT
jgi:hypothetical protein